LIAFLLRRNSYYWRQAGSAKILEPGAGTEQERARLPALQSYVCIADQDEYRSPAFGKDRPFLERNG
jgi:hypothetical protein